MALTKGCLGVIKFDAAAVGEVRTITVSETTSLNPANAMGSCNAVFSAGVVESTISGTAWFDSADVGQDEIVVGASTVWIYQPAGTGSGLAQKTGTAIFEQYDVSGDVDGIVEVSFSMKGGAVTRTAQA